MWEECVQALNLVYYRSHRSLVSKLEQMAVSEGRGRGGTAGPSVGPSVDIEKLTDNIYLSFLNTIERQLVIHSKFHILLNAAIVALPEPAVVGPRPKLESVKSKIEFMLTHVLLKNYFHKLYSINHSSKFRSGNSMGGFGFKRLIPFPVLSCMATVKKSSAAL